MTHCVDGLGCCPRRAASSRRLAVSFGPYYLGTCLSVWAGSMDSSNELADGHGYEISMSNLGLLVLSKGCHGWKHRMRAWLCLICRRRSPHFISAIRGQLFNTLFTALLFILCVLV